jgi:hypothetical protein
MAQGSRTVGAKETAFDAELIAIEAGILCVEVEYVLGCVSATIQLSPRQPTRIVIAPSLWPNCDHLLVTHSYRRFTLASFSPS